MSNMHAVYEANEQKAPKEDEHKGRDRFDEAPSNAHKGNDPQDQRSIANRLENEARKDDDSGKKNISQEAKLAQIDPTLPAKMKGNEPSKGAKIDKQIQEEEEEELRRKGKM